MQTSLMQLRQPIFEWDEQDDSKSFVCEMLHSGFLQTDDDAGDSMDKFEPFQLHKVVSEPSIDSAVASKKAKSKPRPTNQGDIGGRLLGDSFILGVWDVLCGRGRDAYDHIGNRRLRLLVAASLEEYVTGNRQWKTQIIRNIVDQILDASGRFIKKDEHELCYEVSLFYAREKVGHIFRDCVRQAQRKNLSAKSLGAQGRGLHATQDSIFRGMNIQTTFESTTNMDEKEAQKNRHRDVATQPDRPMSFASNANAQFWGDFTSCPPSRSPLLHLVLNL